MKKTTLVCIHIMPSELEMFERFMMQYRKELMYLDGDDDVTIKATLNLNPELTDWKNSEYKQDYFITRFSVLFNGIKNINEIILDTSCWGTTHQKRDSYKLDYDQFVFVDADIVMHEHTLKYQLNIAKQLDGMYIVSPSLPRWWDGSWDGLTHSGYLDKEFGYAHSEDAINNAYTQPIENVVLKQLPNLKFGCGMHTLYSKSFWELVTIPEAFGGYGPEDTFGMTAGQIAIRNGYSITQIVIDGIYITEDTINKTPSFIDKIKPMDLKKKFYDHAMSVVEPELINVAKKIIENKPNS